MTLQNFSELGLAEPILRALNAENYTTPTPIQAQAIPLLLAGKDLLGIAQTGTGKTAAFSLPLLHHLAATKPQDGKGSLVPKSTRALILAPTRELAVQIGDSIKTYGRNLGLKIAVIFGGVGLQPQINILSRGVDIVVATPGRLLDHVGQRTIRLDQVTHLVLDEADRMLDMGFVKDVRKIVGAIPKERQSLLFSATMPTDVADLAKFILHNPTRIEITPAATTVERIDQRVFFVDSGAKRSLLTKLMNDPEFSRVIIFTRTKHGANRVAEHLDKAGIPAEAIHGNKSQGARQRALENFRDGGARALVATDIMARGIDIDDVTHVINFELPNIPESYVHRIGRTARAGTTGVAVSFCDSSEKAYLRDIERLTKHPLTVMGGYSAPANAPANNNAPQNKNRGDGNRNKNGRPSDHNPHHNQGRHNRSENRFEGRQDGRKENRQPRGPIENMQSREQKPNGLRKDERPARPQRDNQQGHKPFQKPNRKPNTTQNTPGNTGRGGEWSPIEQSEDRNSTQGKVRHKPRQNPNRRPDAA